MQPLFKREGQIKWALNVKEELRLQGLIPSLAFHMVLKSPVHKRINYLLSVYKSKIQIFEVSAQLY